MTELSISPHTVSRVHRIDAQEWRVLRSGQGSRVVLLLPGGAGQAEAEFQLIRALQPHVRVVAVTYPSLGSLSALVQGIAGVLDAEGLRVVDVWGNSFGGMVAQVLVRAAPERVRSLALGRTAVPDASRARRAEAQRRFLGLLPAPTVRQLVRMAFDRLLRDLPKTERQSWASYLEEHVLPHAKERMVALSALAADFYARYDIAADDLVAWPGRVLLLEADGDEL